MNSMFEDIIFQCNHQTIEEIFANQELKQESVREKEYISLVRKEALNRNANILEKIKILLGKQNSTYLEWFKWSQCKNPLYNKYFKVLLYDLIEHTQEYVDVFEMLEDRESRRVFEDIVAWRFCRESKYLVDAYSVSKNEQYLEQFEYLNDKELFVDCGGYIGDSTMALINYAGGVFQAYVYEADSSNMDEAKTNLDGYNIIFRNVGIGEKKETLFFSGLGLSSSGFTKEGSEKVNVVSIDSDIPDTEKITFLKMDIEGMELKALKGGKKHIEIDRPILAICLYHNPCDIREIPLFIKDIVGTDYKFYIRHYTPYHGETVFYAVPKERYNGLIN